MAPCSQMRNRLFLHWYFCSARAERHTVMQLLDGVSYAATYIGWWHSISRADLYAYCVLHSGTCLTVTVLECRMPLQPRWRGLSKGSFFAARGDWCESFSLTMRYKPGFGNGVVSGAVGGLCCALPRLSCARRAGPTATLFILVLVASILAGCIPAVSEQNHLSGTAAGSQMPTEPDLQSVIAAKKQSPGGSSAALAAQRHAEEEAATRYLIAGTEARLLAVLTRLCGYSSLALRLSPETWP